MAKRCVIVSGGELSAPPRPEPGDFIIACDRGYLNALALGLRPDLVISDFDSYDGDIPAEIPLLRLPSVKDDTDTMAAVRYAAEQGFASVRLCCALGGRLDHSLANLQTLVFAHRQGMEALLETEDVWIRPLGGGERIELPRRAGWSLSLFAVSDRCTGLSIRGAKYELEDAVLENSFPLGVSNEWTADAAQIALQSGVLLIVLSRME